MADLRTAVEQVKAATKSARPRATILLPLPIYEGRFAAEFRVLDPERFRVFAESSADESKDEDERFREALDFIADACRQIHALIDGKPEPLEADGVPVRFDQRFANALGLELESESAAAVVQACWSLDDGSVNRLALNAYGVRLIEWMEDTTRRVEGELLGESSGGRPLNGRAALPQPA